MAKRLIDLSDEERERFFDGLIALLKQEIEMRKKAKKRNYKAGK